MKEKYIQALMDNAERWGQTSEAKRLKVGAMLYKRGSVIAMGINGQPEGWPTEVCEDEDNTTLPTVRHAEAAALEKLWRSPETAEGSILFISHAPCLACAIKLATAGVVEVYYRHLYRDESGLKYLEGTDIKVTQVK